MNEANICMFGPKSVGKTSLLTTMYEQFENDISNAKLQLTPDLESASLLQDRLADLKSLFATDEVFFSTGGVISSSVINKYIFELGRLGQTPTLKLNFTDFPGSWISLSADKSDREMVNNFVEQSQGVILAIHAPALMEKEGKFNEEMNRPDEITNFFKRNYISDKIKQPRLVILAPIKCEKYMHNNSTALIDNIKKSYKKLLDLFSSEGLMDKITVVITPVQTTGNIVLGKVEVVKDQRGLNIPQFYFTKNSSCAVYDPKDSEQPLRYLLSFFLKLHLNSQENCWGIFSFIRDWFGMDKYLRDSVAKFASACKRDKFFVVLQGERWLK